MIPTVYLDTCCLQRILDDQTQPRVRDESLAMRAIFVLGERADVELVTSTVVDDEIAAIANRHRRLQVELLANRCSRKIQVEEAIQCLAETFARLGLTPFDALHLACAAHEEISYLLTTDDRFVARASRLPFQPTQVLNPVNWLGIPSMPWNTRT